MGPIDFPQEDDPEGGPLLKAEGSFSDKNYVPRHPASGVFLTWHGNSWFLDVYWMLILEHPIFLMSTNSDNPQTQFSDVPDMIIKCSSWIIWVCGHPRRTDFIKECWWFGVIWGLVWSCMHPMFIFFQNTSGVVRRNHSVNDWVKFIWDDGEKTTKLFWIKVYPTLNLSVQVHYWCV